MRSRPRTFFLALLLATPAVAMLARPLAAATVRGKVETENGVAIEHARIRDTAGGRESFSRRDGGFAIADCELPCLLEVHHPRFEDREIQVTTAEDLLVVLRAKQAVYEEIVVTASRDPADGFAPASIASTVVRDEERTAISSTLTELVEGVPGVAENGQGGIFQTFSIRGTSRQRVLTLVDGIPIYGPRRAGVSTSFLDPLLMGAVEVLRGPASTHWGSGALGGVVQIFPRWQEGPSLQLGWESFGNETYQVFGVGDDRWSMGLARRSSDNDTAADGTPLDGHFTQTSALFISRWREGPRRYELLVLPALGRDIGKSTTDFPGRITSYPRERHLLLRLGIDADTWRVYAWAHPNDLETETLRPAESRNVVRNDAFDFGLHAQHEASLGDRLSARFGLDYVGRRGVDAEERDEDLATGDIGEVQTLDGGEEDEAAAYVSVRWSPGATDVQAGARFTWQRQDNGGAPSHDDSSLSGFVGLVRPLASGLELTANLGTGLRFPTLSERFFTGTTGRGEIVGNPDLDAERSLNADLGLRWFGSRVFLAAQVFRQRIDDFVERVEIEEDVLVYVNLDSGTIRGLEIEGFFEPTDRWRLWWSGHLLEGEDAAGQPLSDVPADRLQLGARYRRGDWESRFRIQHRAELDDPGSGEKAIPEVDLVSLALSYTLRPGWTLTLRGANLLDETWFNSADRKSPVAPGRSVGLGLAWAPDRSGKP